MLGEIIMTAYLIQVRYYFAGTVTFEIVSRIQSLRMCNSVLNRKKASYQH
jgi:hypothetical protein